MPESSKEYVLKFTGDISGLLKSLTSVEQVTNRMQQTLGKQGDKVAKILGTSFSNFKNVSKLDSATGQLQNLGQEIGQTSTKVKLANGVIGTYTETVKRMKDGTIQVVGSFKQASTATESYGEAMNRLFKRALLTIPVWFLLRNAIMKTGQVLRQGLTDIVSFDRALQKAKRNLQGSASEIATNFEKLRIEVTQLALATGVSVEKITNAFQKFATVGFDFETSLTGATVATKLAVTLFGDAEENANALARAFRVLADNTNDTRSKSQQLEEVGALLNNLWKDQAFEINEIASALERFAPIANAAGFSIMETVKVLAALQTAGIRETRAGRLLSTAIQQLDKNFAKISSTLGLELNPQTTTTLERFLAVNRAIAELNKTDKLKATEAIKELYGGVRGGEAPRALIAVADILEDVLKRTGDVKQFNKEFEDVNETIAILTDRFHQANREIGKALVSGIVGGKDWADTLKSIVTTLENLRGVAGGTGRIIASVFRPITTLFDPENINLFADLPLISIIDEFGKMIGESAGKASIQADLAGQEVAEKLFTSFNKALKGGLSKNELNDFLIQLTTFGGDFLKIDPAVFDTMVRKTKEMLDNFTEIKDEQEQINELSQVQADAIAEKIIASRLKELQLQGALNSEQLKAEQNLRKQFNLQETFIDSLERQLDLERSIKEEKRLQSRLGSDSVRLFEIAQNQGLEIAQEIGDALAGNVDFSTFIRRGGEAVEIFKQEFSDVFKQQQAQAFFRGETVPGASGLRGGTRIAIEEERIRQGVPLFDTQAQIRASQAQGQLLRVQATQPVANVNVTNEFNINLDPSNIEEFGDQAVDKVAKQLPQVGTKINQALAQAVNGTKQARRI